MHISPSSSLPLPAPPPPAPEEEKEDPEVRRVYFNQGKYFPYDYGAGQPEKPYLPLQIRFSRTLAKLFSGLQQFNFNEDDELKSKNAILKITTAELLLLR